jgi:hypothetical protein
MHDPRSPDLTPFDFFLWGYVKSILYVPPPLARNLNIIQERLEEALRNVPRDMIIRSMQDIFRRVEVCLQVGGGHVEGCKFDKV